MNFDKLVNKTLLENRLDLSEGIMADVGHVLLDIAGIIPGLGEIADITNAIWYCKQKQYLYACLSLISCIPELGDILGKGTKYAIQIEKLGVKILQVKRLIKKYRVIINKLLEKAKQNEKLAPYVEQMQQALIAFAGKY
jgi:hypothetical protein